MIVLQGCKALCVANTGEVEVVEVAKMEAIFLQNFTFLMCISHVRKDSLK